MCGHHGEESHEQINTLAILKDKKQKSCQGNKLKNQIWTGKTGRAQRHVIQHLSVDKGPVKQHREIEIINSTWAGS